VFHSNPFFFPIPIGRSRWGFLKRFFSCALKLGNYFHLKGFHSFIWFLSNRFLVPWHFNFQNWSSSPRFFLFLFSGVIYFFLTRFQGILGGLPFPLNFVR